MELSLAQQAASYWGKDATFKWTYFSYFWRLRAGCVIPDDFVKLDFEIAVDQQTRDRDRTFEGFRTPGAHQCRWPNFFEDLNQKYASHNESIRVFSILKRFWKFHAKILKNGWVITSLWGSITQMSRTEICWYGRVS